MKLKDTSLQQNCEH